MKAIRTRNLCLTCHIAHVDSKLRAQLDSLYPFDPAIGFHLDRIRGAYSLNGPGDQHRKAP